MTNTNMTVGKDQQKLVNLSTMKANCCLCGKEATLADVRSNKPTIDSAYCGSCAK